MSSKNWSSLAFIISILVFVVILATIIFFIWSSDYDQEQRLFLSVATTASAFFISTLILLFRGNGRSANGLSNAEITGDNYLFVELYQNSPVPYIRTDKKGKIISANAAAVRLFKETEEDLLGKDFFSTVRGEGKEADHVERIPYLVRTGNFINDQEVVLARSDNSERWVMLSAFPYAGKSEFLITLVDITKQKNIDTAKSEFVSLASHQLRTPLSAIKWNLELLASPKMGDLNTEQEKYIDKISRSAERMVVLIADFLNASQLEMGTFSSTIEEISLTPFINDQLEEFEAKIHQKQHQMDLRFPPESMVIEADSHLLRMCVNNLISNAIKYTPNEGAIVVGYTASASAVSITVRDNGMGIPESEQERMFSKFYRATNVRTSAISGTGIGLYIIKQAVNLMGGNITFSSQEGEGTEFVITIPIKH